MEELDANGDGEIDFQEFMAMMSNQDLQRFPTLRFADRVISRGKKSTGISWDVDVMNLS